MTTLESRFQARLDEFRRKKADAPQRRARLDQLRAELATTCVNERPDEHYALAARVAEEDRDLRLIESGVEEVEYLLQVAPFIREYNEDSTEGARGHTVTAPHPSLDDFVTINSRSQKSHVLQRYLTDVEGDVDAAQSLVAGSLVQQSREAAEDHTCSTCDVAMLRLERESRMVCPECGVAKAFIDAQLTYDQEVSQVVTTSFSYKRLNHFTEWLNSLQGKENTEVPPDIIDAVREEFRKARITSRSAITAPKVRQYLKKLGQNRHYEHSNLICNILNGVPAPRFPVELENRLKYMFSVIQAPFEKWVPRVQPARKNFLSYSYVLYKLCELLGKDEFLQHFPLLKSSEKLHAQDVIWRAICEELGWQFIKSV